MNCKEPGVNEQLETTVVVQVRDDSGPNQDDDVKKRVIDQFSVYFDTHCPNNKNLLLD